MTYSFTSADGSFLTQVLGIMEKPIVKRSFIAGRKIWSPVRAGSLEKNPFKPSQF